MSLTETRTSADPAVLAVNLAHAKTPRGCSRDQARANTSASLRTGSLFASLVVLWREDALRRNEFNGEVWVLTTRRALRGVELLLKHRGIDGAQFVVGESMEAHGAVRP